MPQASYGFLPAAGDSGAFGNFGQFIQKNPELVKAGTGILSGLGQVGHAAGADGLEGAHRC